MRLPKRQSQLLRRSLDPQEGPVYLTDAAIQRMKDEITRLEKKDRPQIVEDLSRAIQLGDLSENAEYQSAKAQLSRIDGRLFSLKERLKRAVLIQKDAGDGSIHLGSTVVLETGGKTKTYTIVGPHESNPAYGRISHLSPLGSALLNHTAEDTVQTETPTGQVAYRIIEVK